jgi:hypothetical protein
MTALLGLVKKKGPRSNSPIESAAHELSAAFMTPVLALSLSDASPKEDAHRQQATRLACLAHAFARELAPAWLACDPLCCLGKLALHTPH